LTQRLVDICEPLFQYICTLNRSARKGGGIYDPAQVRADLKQILADMKYAASQDTSLLQRYEQIELVLLFFVDSMIKRSQLSFAEDWQNLAYERGEMAGEDRFFEMLDETLEDRSDAATDKLAVFYTCIGLGFTGWHTGQPEVLRRKMLEISARVRALFENNPQAYICPDAYAHLNTSNLIQPPAASLGGIAIAMLGLLGVLLVAYVYLYRDGSDELRRSLDTIIDSENKSVAAMTHATGGR
jgi:type VI protein secretion system component VasF